MTLVQVRILAGVLVLAALVLAVIRRHALWATLRAYFLEPSPPETLALVRIASFGALAWVGTQTKAVFLAAQPASLRVLPPGWAFVDGVLPIDAETARHAQWWMVSAAICAALGLLTRVSAPLAAVAAVYLLGTPSFFGKVLHQDHALVLMALVLSVAPIGDALSIDRLWRRRRGEPAPLPSSGYTLPMRLCWLLLGTIYLFPGLWKVWDNGDLWLNGQRLLWELHDEWGKQTYLDPPVRIDRYPWLLALLGTATLVFEVGFFFALWQRGTRVLAALSACAFHVGVRLFLGIKFYPYVPLLMLIDLPWVARLRARFQQDTGPVGIATRRMLIAPALVGGLLLVGQTYVAAARIETWPVALHPVFGERSGPGAVTRGHRITLEPAGGGKRRDLIALLSKHKAGNGFKRAVLRFDRDVSGGVPRAATSRDIVGMLRDNGIDARTGDRIVIYKTSWKTFPIGERTDYQEKLMRRYVITRDAGLERLARGTK